MTPRPSGRLRVAPSKVEGRLAALARGRALRIIMTAAFVVIAGSSSLLACPMCFGAEETSLIDGTRLGIIVMLGITIAVQGAFVGFFVYLRKHAKRAAEMDLDDEWSELQRPSKTT